MKQLFLNLPVKDLETSQAFYEALGFTLNPLFSGENQKCLVWSDHMYVMLQSRAFSGKHIGKPIADFNQVAGPSFTLPLPSLEDVNILAEKGLVAGGREPIPMIDEGFMQVRSIEDPDGYTWGLLYLDLVRFKTKS